MPIHPMPSERDIWATANVLIKQYGDQADLEAARHYDHCLENGALDGCRFWKAVLRVIDELRRTGLESGEALQ